MVGDRQGDARRRVSLELSEPLLERIEALKGEWGLRGRGAVVMRLLEQLFEGFDGDGGAEPPPQEARAEAITDAALGPAANAGAQAPDGPMGARAPQGPAQDGEQSAAVVDPGGGAEATGFEGLESAGLESSGFEETAAIVLVPLALDTIRDQGRDPDETGGQESAAPAPAAPGGGGGIDLPGFVRRRSREIRRSLHPPRPAPGREPAGLALISAEHLQAAAEACQSHWREIYGQPAQAPVLEAAMVWLAREIWPRSDQSEGRPFTWSLTQRVLGQVAAGWEEGPASFERVITAAGILEDPFSGGTLAVRVPTLITRFVQWARSRQKRGTSFHVLDQTLTVTGSLRLLELPTDANVPITLAEIREAYREQAQRHHPDAGGSADAMRRLNEAYQLLKERYHKPST